jgi:hypothetical protein
MLVNEFEGLAFGGSFPEAVSLRERLPAGLGPGAGGAGQETSGSWPARMAAAMARLPVGRVRGPHRSTLRVVVPSKVSNLSQNTLPNQEEESHGA